MNKTLKYKVEQQNECTMIRTSEHNRQTKQEQIENNAVTIKATHKLFTFAAKKIPSERKYRCCC